jgi:hypothetical protein
MDRAQQLQQAGDTESAARLYEVWIAHSRSALCHIASPGRVPKAWWKASRFINGP